MDLIALNANFSRVSEQLTLIQDYIALKFGLDFEVFCKSRSPPCLNPEIPKACSNSNESQHQSRRKLPRRTKRARKFYSSDSSTSTSTSPDEPNSDFVAHAEPFVILSEVKTEEVEERFIEEIDGVSDPESFDEEEDVGTLKDRTSAEDIQEGGTEGNVAGINSESEPGTSESVRLKEVTSTMSSPYVQFISRKGRKNPNISFKLAYQGYVYSKRSETTNKKGVTTKRYSCVNRKCGASIHLKNDIYCRGRKNAWTEEGQHKIHAPNMNKTSAEICIGKAKALSGNDPLLKAEEIINRTIDTSLDVQLYLPKDNLIKRSIKRARNVLRFPDPTILADQIGTN